MKRKIRKNLTGPVNTALELLLDVQLISAKVHGLNLMRDLKHLLGSADYILDVGANRGQFARRLRDVFPDAEMHCFEPHPEEFAHLKESCREIDASVHQLALGAEPGTSMLYVGPSPTAHSLLPLHENDPEGIPCTVETLDRWESGKIVDVLKIDTEGFDLEVLRGGERMLRERRARTVIVEVGFEPETDRFASFETMRAWLNERGYSPFGIYDQCIVDKALFYANACFVPKLA